MAATLRRILIALTFSLIAGGLAPAAGAETAAAGIGIVLMHGKGGAPTKHVADLAAALEAQGLLVANLEMPWSGRRDYDADVAAAEKEVAAALSSLRDKGARKLFVAGHSQGGLFALYCGGRHAIDGVIAIAPGGNVASPLFREKLGAAVDQARQLVAEGKGEEKTRLLDFESSRGSYPVIATPAAYLSWFAPEGAMNQMKAVRGVDAAVPVLFIVPTNDYPGLLGIKQQMFDALPRHPRTKLHEPNASHLEAPSASLREIVDWTAAVANGR